MDHNNSDEKKCSCGASVKNCAFCQTCTCKKNTAEKPEKKYCMCPHGMCKDHSPEWINDGEAILVPYPLGIFESVLGWSYKRCCEKVMTRYKKVQPQKCKKCGRKRELETETLVRCECCGHRHSFATNHPGP
ncbi:MAG: hypothetical protein ACYC3G_02755 [Minisyncoccota bacterium]